jgi:phosphoglycerate kinase
MINSFSKPILIQNISNSIVLLRVSFDIPSLADIDRIKDSKDSVDYLLKNNNKVILLTKWGKIKTNEDLNSYSTKKLAEVVSEVLEQPVKYFNQFEYWQNIDQLKSVIKKSESNLILFENTHFIDQEKSKDSSLRLNVANQYANIAHYFVDDCFPSSHRKEATNCEIKQILPGCLGFGYQKEVDHLAKLNQNPGHPFLVIMGGAKLETKLALIEKMLNKADRVILGGLLAFTFLKAKEELGLSFVPVYNSLVEEEFIDTAKNIIQRFGDKLVLPVDLVYELEDGQKLARDIGSETIDLFNSQISEAKTIFWNGPMGFVEKKPFDHGTELVARFIAELKDCYTVIGGGDSVASVDKEILSKFSFVSMGGGATLDFLSA